MKEYDVARRITGTASRKENLAASCRSNPRNRAAVIVTPERDVPGTRASACAAPIISPSASVTCEMSRSRRPYRSATIMSIA